MIYYIFPAKKLVKMAGHTFAFGEKICEITTDKPEYEK